MESTETVKFKIYIPKFSFEESWPLLCKTRTHTDNQNTDETMAGW